MRILNPKKIRIINLSQKNFVVILIIALLAPIFLMYGPYGKVNQTKAAWYGEVGYEYRQKFQISSSASLTDFQVALDEGEVSRWKFDEASGNALDVSGNLLTATDSGTSVVAGKYSNARNFNGSSSYLYSATGDPKFYLSDGYTLSAWIKPAALTGTRRLISQWGGTGAGNASWSLGLNGAYVEIANYNGSSAVALTDNTTALQTGNWYHVVGVYTGGTTGTNAYIYINGTAVKSGTLTAVPQMSTNYYVGIGRCQVIGSDNYYSGDMDEVRIYKRGMSSSEVSYLYSNNVSPKLQQVYANTLESGADLRFTTSDQTTNIPYWIENYTASGQNAKIWLKVPSVANGTTDIYMYYKNASAVAASSGSNTFILYDDFESYNTGDLPTNSNWGNRTGTWQVSTSYAASGTKSLYSSGGGGGDSMSWLNSSYTTDNGVLEMKIYTNPAISADSRRGPCTRNTSTPTQGHCFLDGGNGAYPHWLHSQVVWGTAGSYTMSSSAWHNMKIKFNSTDLYGYADGVNVNWVRSTATGTYTGITGGRVAGYYDDVRIRKYAITEPTVALSGSAELGDITAPDNPTLVTAKSTSDGITLNASNYYNFSQPYFEWPAAETAGGAHDTGGGFVAGVAGYYSYFGTSCGVGGADPATSRGLLSEIGGTGIHYSSALNVTIPNALSTPGTYCLRIKTKDNVNNIQSTTWEAFLYQFDNVSPATPSYVVANPAGYSATDSFSMSWPAVSDGSSSPQSGISGYQYKRGDGSGDSWSDIQSATSVSDIHKYQDGANSFILRSVDNASNYSSEVQTTYYYSNNPPPKPTALTASPELSDSNSFSFSWTAPVHSLDIADYGYSINQYPNDSNIIWRNSTNTSIAAGPYATLQGINTIYLLAKDEGGVYSYETSSVASVQFVCQTPVPPTPTSFSAHDSSDRITQTWMITLNWLAGVPQNEATFDHYAILRSTDNQNFSQIATTKSTAYIDSDGLINDVRYYYRVKAVDNANRESVASPSVSAVPTGRFTSPPIVLNTPYAQDIKSNQAKISWVTNRACLSFVSYGTSSTNLSDTKGDMQSVSDHNVTISGLKPNTKYYFRVQSIDEFRDYDEDLTYSGIYEFNTNTTAQISNVSISNLTLNSVDISWDTSVATSAIINYGGSINYGLTYDRYKTSYVSRHTISLSGLNHSSLYHFRISGYDQDGVAVNSDDYTFETLKMPKISSIIYTTDYSGTSPVMVITWKTNVPTTSAINYYPSDGSVSEANEAAKSSLVTDHAITLSGLSVSTQYKFTLSGRDQFGNLVEGDENVLITDADKRPAVITDLAVENSSIGEGTESKAQLIIYWKTDEPCTSQVEYDDYLTSGSQYRKKSYEDNTLKTEHLVNITGLDPVKLYHLRAISKDKAGNISYSEDRVVVSGEATISPFTRIINMFNDMFGWISKYF